MTEGRVLQCLARARTEAFQAKLTQRSIAACRLRRWHRRSARGAHRHPRSFAPRPRPERLRSPRMQARLHCHPNAPGDFARPRHLPPDRSERSATRVQSVARRSEAAGRSWIPRAKRGQSLRSASSGAAATTAMSSWGCGLCWITGVTNRDTMSFVPPTASWVKRNSNLRS